MLQKYLVVWNEGVGEADYYGTDVSLDPDFEELRREVEKDVSLYGGAATDWEQVFRLSSHILQTQSKDIWALCYAIRAAYALEGAHGCAFALSEACKLFLDHWDGLYPSTARPQRRAAPFLWLAARLESLFPPESFARMAPETRTLLKTNLENLQTLLEGKFGETGPSFSAILRAIPDPLTEDKAKTAQEGALAQQPSVPAPSGLSAAELLKAIDGDGRVPAPILPQLLRAAQEQTQQLGAHYLACDSTDWRVYLLHRAGLWGTINQLPLADASGLTQTRSIPNDKAAAYAAAVENKQYALILPQLERSASKAPFWLDGHHLVARCLEALGAKDAHRTLCVIFLQFIRRLPGLTECKFHDGTPFAGERTKQFIARLATTFDDAKENPGAAVMEAGEQDGAADPLERALAVYAERGFEAGLRSLGDIAAGRNRAAVRHALLKARYCRAAGRQSAAAHLLKALYAQLEAWGMLDWEPELTAAVISCLNAASPQKGGPTQDMLKTLHWLHLETALGIVKE